MKCHKKLLLAVGFALVPTLASVAPAQLPPSKGAPHVGEKAPDFTLPDSSGKPMKLSELLATPLGEGAPAKRAPWMLLIFYRGYW